MHNVKRYLYRDSVKLIKWRHWGSRLWNGCKTWSTQLRVSSHRRSCGHQSAWKQTNSWWCRRLAIGKDISNIIHQVSSDSYRDLQESTINIVMKSTNIDHNSYMPLLYVLPFIKYLLFGLRLLMADFALEITLPSENYWRFSKQNCGA